MISQEFDQEYTADILGHAITDNDPHRLQKAQVTGIHSFPLCYSGSSKSAETRLSLQIVYLSFKTGVQACYFSSAVDPCGSTLAD